VDKSTEISPHPKKLEIYPNFFLQNFGIETLARAITLTISTLSFTLDQTFVFEESHSRGSGVSWRDLENF